MDDTLKDLIITEVRENRKEISKLRNEITGLKVKFGMIATIFGIVGSFVTRWISHL